MPHIHSGENEHDLTVTGYIVRIDTSEPKVLLHMHRKLHLLLPIGGHVELTETPWQAMAHELTEESGYTLDQLEVLQPRSRIKNMSMVVQHPYPLSMSTHDITKKHFHTDIEYGFVATSEPALQIINGESEDLRWLSRNELIDLPSEVIFDNTREIYCFLIDTAIKTWDKVPTNEFLLDFPEEYFS